MRAHFAGDVVAADGGAGEAEMAAIDKIEQQQEPVDQKSSDERKLDSKNMEVLTEFIDEVLQKAEVEATKQQNEKNDKNSQQTKEKSRQSFAMPDLKNGKMVNRARGFVVRIFDAICNCANTAAAPAQRITKFRGKRTNKQANNESNDKADAKEQKTKQLENGKEKIDDIKKIDELEQKSEGVKQQEQPQAEAEKKE